MNAKAEHHIAEAAAVLAEIVREGIIREAAERTGTPVATVRALAEGMGR